ncbi:hypothetical protein SLS58_006440 [Diplodia intermedia]|uniref:Uncharacterized protein n=1 Tax=Diplodia intermedia TaxID=856260 RepID=A0ABR3TN01_9PEZI
MRERRELDVVRDRILKKRREIVVFLIKTRIHELMPCSSDDESSEGFSDDDTQNSPTEDGCPCDAGEKRKRTASPAASSNTRVRGQASATSKGKKRASPSSGREDDDGEDEAQHQRVQLPGPPLERKKQLACPYAKRYPENLYLYVGEDAAASTRPDDLSDEPEHLTGSAVIQAVVERFEAELEAEAPSFREVVDRFLVEVIRTMQERRGHERAESTEEAFAQLMRFTGIGSGAIVTENLARLTRELENTPSVPYGTVGLPLDHRFGVADLRGFGGSDFAVDSAYRSENVGGSSSKYPETVIPSDVFGAPSTSSSISEPGPSPSSPRPCQEDQDSTDACLPGPEATTPPFALREEDQEFEGPNSTIVAQQSQFSTFDFDADPPDLGNDGLESPGFDVNGFLQRLESPVDFPLLDEDAISGMPHAKNCDIP